VSVGSNFEGVAPNPCMNSKALGAGLGKTMSEGAPGPTDQVISVGPEAVSSECARGTEPDQVSTGFSNFMGVSPNLCATGAGLGKTMTVESPEKTDRTASELAIPTPVSAIAGSSEFHKGAESDWTVSQRSSSTASSARGGVTGEPTACGGFARPQFLRTLSLNPRR
jgi:hypothetical protein